MIIFLSVTHCSAWDILNHQGVSLQRLADVFPTEFCYLASNATLATRVEIEGRTYYPSLLYYVIRIPPPSLSLPPPLPLFPAHYANLVTRQSSDVKDVQHGESVKLPHDIPYEK